MKSKSDPRVVLSEQGAKRLDEILAQPPTELQKAVQRASKGTYTKYINKGLEAKIRAFRIWLDDEIGRTENQLDSTCQQGASKESIDRMTALYETALNIREKLNAILLDASE